ncbi:MAG: hypothetical protein HeimC3_43500 [Candidatus Heimdallarchaeota archaeon LC_3]|nr:MAG: hypothetical protein HeimC3_43500 [Candidatus Heimdallarchaeota archaeon LC_3]
MNSNNIKTGLSTAKASIKAAKEISEKINLLRKISEYFSPFEQSTKKVEINYQSRKMRFELIIETPENVKKKKRKVKIPKIEGFSVGYVQNDYFQTIENPWKEEESHWILPIEKINGSRFLIELNGEIDRRSLQNLIKVFSSANRDYTKENDKYLLNAHIKNIELFEKSYKELTIEGVPFLVKVELKKAVSPILPKHLQSRVYAHQRLIETAKGSNRVAFHQARLAVKRAEREGWSIETVKSFISKVTDLNFFKPFIEVSGAFNLSKLEHGHFEDDFILPKTIDVNTETNLTLKQPNSRGELIFQRKNFQEALTHAIDKV